MQKIKVVIVYLAIVTTFIACKKVSQPDVETSPDQQAVAKKTFNRLGISGVKNFVDEQGITSLEGLLAALPRSLKN